MKPTEFIKTINQWQSFKDNILPHLTDKKFKGKLSNYILPRDMSDNEIQKETNSNPIPVEFLASIIQETIKNDTDKNWYIFHTKVKDTVYTLYLDCGDDEWYSDAYSFDNGIDWFQGGVFVSLQSLKSNETLSLKTLDTYTNDELLTELKKRLG